MFIIYEWVDSRGKGVLSNWGLSMEQQAKLDNKIDMLQKHGMDLPPGLVSRTSNGRLFNLKVRGKVQLRPVFCPGPFDGNEFTFLLDVEERDGKYLPSNYLEKAAERLEELINDSNKRREYE